VYGVPEFRIEVEWSRCLNWCMTTENGDQRPLRAHSTWLKKRFYFASRNLRAVLWICGQLATLLLHASSARHADLGSRDLHPHTCHRARNAITRKRRRRYNAAAMWIRQSVSWSVSCQCQRHTPTTTARLCVFHAVCS